MPCLFYLSVWLTTAILRENLCATYAFSVLSRLMKYELTIEYDPENQKSDIELSGFASTFIP